METASGKYRLGERGDSESYKQSPHHTLNIDVWNYYICFNDKAVRKFWKWFDGSL